MRTRDGEEEDAHRHPDGHLPREADRWGATPETLDSLEDWVDSEWGGLEVYLADPGEEEETAVVLEVVKTEVTTD